MKWVIFTAIAVCGIFSTGAGCLMGIPTTRLGSANDEPLLPTEEAPAATDTTTETANNTPPADPNPGNENTTNGAANETPAAIAPAETVNPGEPAAPANVTPANPVGPEMPPAANEPPPPPPPPTNTLPPGVVLRNDLRSPCTNGASPECIVALEDAIRGALFQTETPDPSGLTRVARLATCPGGGFIYIEALRDGVSNSTTTLVPQAIVQPGEKLLFEVATFYDASLWKIEAIDESNVAIAIYIIGGMLPYRAELDGKALYFGFQIDGAGGYYLNGVPAQIFAAGADICFAQ